ncbi:hypothetical protein SAMN05216516_10743 [Izhakiella capsodis]|uniref:Homeodomain-like domain-containing protein n=1 Tax=Izhakiella capsodis TaxID=1367852 RepID=A0A1I4YUG0_9GAMM|nr:hypothetical protein [Izhakiella capsodis]SFN41597.1 hypothetical protein SAMN05216516_10743 [Izhakiella capsodis]
MEIKLHANATTTPRIRKYIQQSDKSDRQLAKELSISVATVRRWRYRENVADRNTAPLASRKVLNPQQSALINWLRQTLSIPLDELLLMVNLGMGLSVSRAGLDRYLTRVIDKCPGKTLRGKKASKAGLRPTHLRLHYQRINLLPDDGGEWHLLWALEPVSGWVMAQAFAGVSAHLVVSWLSQLLDDAPCDIQSIETENKKLFGYQDAKEQPLQLWADRNALKIHCDESADSDVALRMDIRLSTLAPSAEGHDLNQVIAHFCQHYNHHWRQKKLGNLSPYDYAQAHR